MTRYRYRPYVPGDEHAINELYLAVTGRKRTVSQFMWQWQDAPGGKGEIWLIEYVNDDGSTKLIGHHGVMPIVFSYGQDDFLAGKTENTMVLPAFRAKILYPKYEQIFLSQYEKRFDLLFSTLGPPAALRQRLMQGYEAKRKWLHFEWSLCPGAFLSRLGISCMARQEKPFFKTLGGLCIAIGKKINQFTAFIPRNSNSLPLQVLSSQEAKKHQFFAKFWDIARNSYGLTPRRNREDLAWRYWDNPYGIHTTFVYEGSKSGGCGYAIVRNIGPQIFRLEDIVIYPIDQALLEKILNTVCEWVHAQGGNILSFSTVADENKLVNFFIKFQKTNLRDKFHSFFNRNDTLMPRKLLNNTLVDSNNKIIDWYVTPFVFEGRV